MSQVNEAPSPMPPAREGEYTVVARRYRPQQFADLIGQEPVAKALVNAIKSDRVAHAYLFTGARGVGKTSAARIMARALNCVRGPTPTPCDQCDICQAVATGEDIDVIEIDGASNRGIDEIRAIRENVAMMPVRARYKIYIIDEVHMLTQQAFNALLKTLEEPPPHVKFIFATTEVQKIPITILSRCQRFDFAGISVVRIVAQLKKIVGAEGMLAEDEALQLIARRAGGSMRDSQSLLDQLLAFGGDKLTAGQVHQLLGTATDERVIHLVQAVIDRQTSEAIRMLDRAADEGLQLGEFLDQLIEYWRGLMLVNCGAMEAAALNVSDDHRPAAEKQSRSLPLDSILAGLDILTATKGRLRNTSHGLILLEMAVVRLSRIGELVPLAQLAQWLRQQGGAVGGTPPSRLPTGKPAPSASRIVGPGEAAKPTGPSLSEMATRTAPVVGRPAVAPPGPLPLTPENLPEIWGRVLAQAGMMLAGQLQKAGLPAIFGPKTLVIRFGPEYNHEYNYCRDGAALQKPEGLLRQITGQEISLRVEISAVAEEIAGAVGTFVKLPVAPSPRDREKEILGMPLFQRITEILGGRLLKLEEGFGTEPPIPEPAIVIDLSEVVEIGD